MSSSDSVGDSSRQRYIAVPLTSSPLNSASQEGTISFRMDGNQDSAQDPLLPSPSNGRIFGNQQVYQHASQAVWYAMLFNLLIAGIKLGLASFVTRSSALFAEGLHSLADSFNSFTLLFGLRQGNRPPDRAHPFGYGLETNLWALLASLVLLGSAAASIWSGYQQFASPEPLTSIGWAILVLVISVIFEIAALSKASQAVLEEVGYIPATFITNIPTAFKHIKNVHSPTTRFVFFEDLFALLGAGLALAAISLSYSIITFGWLPEHMAHWPDGAASIIIGLMLLGLAFRLFSDNRSVLTGAAAPEPVEDRIRTLVLETHDIWNILDLKTIDQGAAGLFVHLKVDVNPDIPIRIMDDIIVHLKDRLQAHIPFIREVVVEVLADESEQAWNQKFNELVEEGLQEAILRPREVEILKNFYEFTQTEVGEVMIPRPDVVSVELNTSLADAAQHFIESKHSKLPVYKDRVDNLVGVVYERDIFNCYKQGNIEVPLADFLHPIDIYPETKPVSDLLEDFKRKRIQMAAVADEHGAFAGLVTIADIMEELVGELWEDEDPTEEEILLEQVNSNTLLVSGKLDIWDLNERFNLNVPDDDYKTVGGFVFGQLGREPELNDEVLFEGMRFRVNEVEGARIVSIEITSDNLPFTDGRQESSAASE